jgi:hypothetical protein
MYLCIHVLRLYVLTYYGFRKSAHPWGVIGHPKAAARVPIGMPLQFSDIINYIDLAQASAQRLSRMTGVVPDRTLRAHPQCDRRPDDDFEHDCRKEP